MDNKKGNRKFSNLFKKLKKTGKVLHVFFDISFVIYLLSIIALIYNLLLLSGIETVIRIIIISVVIIYFLLYLLNGFAFLISKKKVILSILIFITMLFSAVNIGGSYYIFKTYNIVDDISKEKIIYTTSLIALKDGDISKVGMLEDETNIECNILPNEYIINKNKKYNISKFNSTDELITALINEEVDAIFLSSNYSILYGEAYEDLNNAKVIDSYSKEMANADLVESSDKDITNPFSILLLGVDSKYDGLKNNAAFNGDTIMLITFNPKTLSATIFSIPRDTYVPIACNHNNKGKINSAAAYGTKCMIDTIKQLTDIDIDYYVKINFKGVVSLVDAIGGIDVEVDKPDFTYNGSINCNGKICEQNSDRDFGNGLVYIDYGNQHLNGEQALAYSRNRHQYALSDFKRLEHQQTVVTSIINKVKNIRDINGFYNVLNSVSNNIDSNMSTKQMLNFYNVAKDIFAKTNLSDDELIDITKTYLTGYDLHVYQNNHSMYTFQYYEESLNAITDIMKINLGIKKPELIKSFNFSIDEPYELKVVGKDLSSTKREATLPNFVNKNINEVRSWASTNSINLKENAVTEDCEKDIVISQNIHADTLLSNVSSLEVNVCIVE